APACVRRRWAARGSFEPSRIAESAAIGIATLPAHAILIVGKSVMAARQPLGLILRAPEFGMGLDRGRPGDHGRAVNFQTTDDIAHENGPFLSVLAARSSSAIMRSPTIASCRMRYCSFPCAFSGSSLTMRYPSRGALYGGERRATRSPAANSCLLIICSTWVRAITAREQN